MIKCNLAVLLAERGLKMSDVINDTKLAKNTVRSLYYNDAKGIQFETLETLCEYLNVNPSDLIIYNPIKYTIEVTDSDSEHIYFDIELILKKVKKIKGEVDVHFEVTEFMFNDPSEPPLEIDINIYYSPKIYSEIKQIPQLFINEIEGYIIQKVQDKCNANGPQPLKVNIFVDVIDYREVEE